jgi:hypothetical protein
MINNRSHPYTNPDYLEIEDEHKVDILKNLSELKVKNRL